MSRVWKEARFAIQVSSRFVACRAAWDPSNVSSAEKPSDAHPSVERSHGTGGHSERDLYSRFPGASLSACMPAGKCRVTRPVGRKARGFRSTIGLSGSARLTGANGIFDVHLDGELVFTKSMLGRYPEPDDVFPLMRDKLGGCSTECC